MRRGPLRGVAIVAHCARCGSSPDLYAVRRVRVVLNGRWHDLVVCRSCDQRAGQPAAMEVWALRLDMANPIDVMRFAQRWTADLARVQRTAEHFLGAERYAVLREKYRAEQLADEEAEAKRRAEYEEKYPPRETAPVPEHEWGDDDSDWLFDDED